jgi:hypothetical protein
MYFEKKLSLKQRLVFAGVLLAVAPIVFIGLVVHRQFSVILHSAEDGSSKLPDSGLDQLAGAAHKIAGAHQNDVFDSLRVARGLLTSYGGLTFPRHRHTRWQATNEATHETRPKTLPAVTIGRKFRRSTAPQPPFMEVIGEMSGAACTVFQRMNSAGDMLRIATSTGKAGTYIPAINPDGSANPVIESILHNRQFTGKESISGQPFVTAYEAITKSGGDVQGMLYVGLPENADAGRLRQLVAGIKTGERRYLQTPRQIQAVAKQSRRFIGWALLISLLGSTLIWLRYAALLARPLTAFAKRLHWDANKLLQTSKEITRTAHRQIEGATLHAGAIEQAFQLSASLHQTAQHNLKHAAAALTMASHSGQHSEKAAEHLDAMQSSMAGIGDANTKIEGIVKSIDEIAFQSRILALNASIEAARAGEAGLSFAVVATEFGKLARRCAEASQATTDVVSGCRKSTAAGSETLKELNRAVRQITGNTGLIETSIQDMHTATEKQARIAGDIGSALHKMEDVVLHNATFTAQSSSAGKRMDVQAGVLLEGTLELSYLVEGQPSDRRRRRNSALLPRKNKQASNLLPKRAQHLHIGAAVNARVAVLNVDHANNFVLRNKRNG